MKIMLWTGLAALLVLALLAGSLQVVMAAAPSAVATPLQDPEAPGDTTGALCPYAQDGAMAAMHAQCQALHAQGDGAAAAMYAQCQAVHSQNGMMGSNHIMGRGMMGPNHMMGRGMMGQFSSQNGNWDFGAMWRAMVNGMPGLMDGRGMMGAPLNNEAGQ